MSYSARVARGGNLLQVTGTAPESEPPKRGEITGFSHASRRRLIRELQSIDRTRAAPVRAFVTLTYPRFFPACSREWKRHLDMFRKRLLREFDVQVAYAKLEPQKRGAPHWHLMIFLDREIPIGWLSVAWWECVGSGDRDHLVAGTNVQRMQSWNGVSSYTSKYVAKTINGAELPSYWSGIKWWTRWGDPPITIDETDVPKHVFIQLRRLMSRYGRSKGIRLKRRSGAAGMYLGGMSLFCPEEVGRRLIDAAVQFASERPKDGDPWGSLTTGGEVVRSWYEPTSERADLLHDRSRPSRTGRRDRGRPGRLPVPSDRAAAPSGPG